MPIGGAHFLKVDIAKNCLIAAGRKLLLRAGELHYTRVAKDQWADRLSRMRKAGLNAVSTYFMWNWHETEEGAFDFTGKSHPKRDVKNYLDLVGESGLMLLARPGPWVCAEWVNGGLPQWLLDKHPEILSLDSALRVTSRLVPHAPVVSYLHPTYLQYVRKWFDQIIPLLDDFDTKYPSKLLMIQADNETCYGFHPSPFDADYNPVNIGSKEGGAEGLYHAWLRRKYREISALNKYYGTQYRDFVQVEAPRAQPRSRDALLAVFDWTAFKEDVITEFLERIADMFRELGIKVPVYVNEQMNYGNVTNIAKKSRHLFDGIDMYPNFIRDVHEANERVVEPIEILKAQSPDKYPACFEFQGGWYNAKIPPNTTHLHQRLGFAHGLKGLSYYMWAGGTNPRGWGTSGESYDYDCAIREDGSDGRRQAVMSLFLNFTHANEETILESEKVAEVGLAYYHPYAYWCASLNSRLAGLAYNIGSEQNRLNLFEDTLESIGFNFEYFDLEYAGSRVASKYKLLVIPLYDFLDEHLQKNLLNFAANGATVLIGPNIPHHGRNMEPCTVLWDALKIRPLETAETESVELIDSGKLSVPKVTLLKAESEEALPIAKVSGSKETCGYLKKIGNGQVIALGFLPRPQDNQGMDALRSFFADLKIEPRVRSRKPEVNVVERISPDGSALLYVTNLSEANVETDITYIDPTIPDKPMEIQGVKIAKRSAVVWPINFKTRLGEIKYMTSEIVAVDDKGEDEIIVRAWGYLGTNGKAGSVPQGRKKKIEEHEYEYSIAGEELIIEKDEGIIKLLIEGIKPISDLP
jgi:beta-galactosidase